MSGMEVDSLTESNFLSPRDRIIRRLVLNGFPADCIHQLQPGLISLLKENKSLLPELVSAILPAEEDIAEAFLEGNRLGASGGTVTKDLLCESILWLQWLMFEDEPNAVLMSLGKMSVGDRGVCGAVWGRDDLAFRCRTCEHDPTCAICVPCFQNGNHKDHDYSVIYTGGGCCDCGDETAWKREGFCSKHKGTEQIQPLNEEVANSAGPVLDQLFIYWKDKLLSAETVKLLSAETVLRGDAGVGDQVVNELTVIVVEMLLEFRKYSESLLYFVSRKVFSSTGLLDVLVRAERFLTEQAVEKLHELLLKMLGEPLFKYEFAKVFVNYYPVIVKEVIKSFSDNVTHHYPLLSNFSVQIFTVPNLTLSLVKEMKLLVMLLECLGDIFNSCSGEDGRVQVVRWYSLCDITIRVVEDIRYVVSHAEVPKYVTCEQPDISRTWMRLLIYVQGMDPQKRVMGLHVEEENENMHMPFILGHSIANIHSFLVQGVFSLDEAEETGDDTFLKTLKHNLDDTDGSRHTKLGRISQESSVCSMTARSNTLDCASKISEIKFDSRSQLLIPCSLAWLIFECLRAIKKWLALDATSTTPTTFYPDTGCSNFLALKRTFFNIMEGSDDKILDADCSTTSEALQLLNLSIWPDIKYDVSSQEISVHLPLHRLLTVVLQKILERCYGKTVTETNLAFPLSSHCHYFFGEVLKGCHPYGFSAFMMEHPLRIRVFCAEVRAGMWRKNRDAAVMNYEWYRSVRWAEQGLELDLFLLQCCAAMAPPDLFVERVLERFGLSNYLSLNLERCSKYEPVLVQEMLTLIIQIVVERRFCGLSNVESLQRELVYKLSTGDPTHSQLVKSLPDDLSKHDQLQNILDTVAVYSNPSGLKQGKYSLRKSYWKELDLYHPRWNSRDLQLAEERYLRFCKVSAMTTQLPRWTKVFSPLSGVARIVTSKVVFQIVRAVLCYAVLTDKSTVSRAPDGVLLTALHLLSLALDVCSLQNQLNNSLCEGTSDFVKGLPLLAFACEEIHVGSNNRSGELEAQSLLSLLTTLMSMHKKENLSNFMEAGNCNLSSFIEILLKKFAELDINCMNKLQILAPEVVSQSIPCSNFNFSRSTFDTAEHKMKARERQAAILEKMRAAQSKFMATLNSTENDDLDSSKSEADTNHVSEESDPVICSLCRDPDSRSPLSFLVLLQKSRLLSFVERGPPSWEQSLQSDKKHLSVIKNEVAGPFGRSTTSCNSKMISSSQILQFAQNAVNEFSHVGLPSEVDGFLNFIKARLPSARNVQRPRAASDSSMDIASSLEMIEKDMYQSIQRQMHDIMLHSNVTHDNYEFSTAGEGLMGSKNSEFALLGKYMSNLSRGSLEHPTASKKAFSHSDNASSKFTISASNGFGPQDCDGIHISSCGHAVHHECWSRYLSSLKERFSRRIGFEGGHIVDPDQGEFLCPVCRRLANSILPIMPRDSKKVAKQNILSDISSTPTTVSSATATTTFNVLHLQQAFSLLQTAANMVGERRILKALPLQWNERTRLDLEPIFHLLCRLYFPEIHDKFLSSGRVSHSMILWDTLRYSLMSTEIAARDRSYASSGRSTSGLEALYEELESSTGFILRLLIQVVQSTTNKNSLRVLLRFRGIQLFAESICSGVSMDESSAGAGNLSSILKHLDKGILYPDIQFWTRAADPVLAHDPFSSLMWLLFCLPNPCLSSMESFLSLVHLFYSVSIIQGIATYCGRHQLDTTELRSGGGLISSVCKIIGKSGVSVHYFTSNHIDSSFHIKDVIRRLSLPYLRRCALLWKLLKSSMTEPFCDKSVGFDRSYSHGNQKIAESTSDFSADLKEFQELENIFRIPSLDVVLEDKILHALALKWFKNFFKDIEDRNFGHIFHFTPVVPFKLMQLPHIYQDLLQRYIKQQCPNCKVSVDDPALCLLCGRLCSSNWKQCCRESGCHNHATNCGAGVGVFLLIRRTTVLLQRSGRQASWPSPYLDAFGEEDIEMRRGRPLYLNDERYAALTYLVASHGLDQSSEVLRQTTIDTFFIV